MSKFARPFVISLLLPIGLAWLGLSRALGAHPFWDVQTIAIGASIGATMALVLSALGVPRRRLLGSAVSLLIGAIVVAAYGKAGFVASFAEDRLAGQFWYFGWIAIGGFLAASVFSATNYR